MVDVGRPGATSCRELAGFSGGLKRGERPPWLRHCPRSRRIFSRVIAPILVGAFGGTVSAEPTRQLRLPVSDQGVTSYGTYNRLPMGKQVALVNILSGNLVIDSVDLTINGRGVPLVLHRFYNSQDTSVGVFGQQPSRCKVGVLPL
jgi:Domain of unknown function (DUF6531)